MKKLFLIGIIFFIAANAWAGGLLTNTNQSVHFLRNPARAASIEIDAVYTNPAGLAHLPSEGFHFSINNQSAFQTRTITSTFAPFAMSPSGDATKVFKGEAEALFIPSLMAAYKTGNWIFSGSFAIVGGGGSLAFDKGLPSFEAGIAAPLAQIQGAATGAGYTGAPLGYSLAMNLEGTSITYGTQLGATYKINDMFSAFLGARANFVSNGYKGKLNNVSVTNADAVRNHLLYVANLVGGETGMALQGAAAGLTQVENTALTIDAKQSGWGIAPVLGLNFNWEKLNAGIKYEFITKIEIENNTKEGMDAGMDDFKNGVKTPYDIPALLTIGAQYDILPCVTVSAGYHHFFDSNAKMANDKQKYINGGINEYLAGVEWRINRIFLISGGGQITRTGVTGKYQSDLSYSLHSYSLCIGAAADVRDNVRINVGYLHTVYDDWAIKDMPNYAGTGLPGSTTFARTNKVFGVGVDFRF